MNVHWHARRWEASAKPYRLVVEETREVGKQRWRWELWFGHRNGQRVIDSGTARTAAGAKDIAQCALVAELKGQLSERRAAGPKSQPPPSKGPARIVSGGLPTLGKRR